MLDAVVGVGEPGGDALENEFVIARGEHVGGGWVEAEVVGEDAAEDGEMGGASGDDVEGCAGGIEGDVGANEVGEVGGQGEFGECDVGPDVVGIELAGNEIGERQPEIGVYDVEHEFVGSEAGVFVAVLGASDVLEEFAHVGAVLFVGVEVVSEAQGCVESAGGPGFGEVVDEFVVEPGFEFSVGALGLGFVGELAQGVGGEGDAAGFDESWFLVVGAFDFEEDVGDSAGGFFDVVAGRGVFGYAVDGFVGGVEGDVEAADGLDGAAVGQQK